MKKVIIGPPGSGKTWTLMNEIEQQLQKDVGFDEIAFLSFTRSATQEARMRIANRFGTEKSEIPYFRTIHSMCYRILGIEKGNVVNEEEKYKFCKKHGVDYVRSKDIKIEDFDLGSYENLNSENIANGNIIMNFYDVLRNRFLKDIDGISNNKMWKLWSSVFYENPLRKEILMYVDVYKFLLEWKKMKAKNGLYDFGDMLYYVYEQGLDIPVRIMIVDEFQDITRLQYEILKSWMENKDYVVVAGDPEQAIYSFMGASSTFLNKEYISADKKVFLPKSFRMFKNVKNYVESFLGNNVSDMIKREYDAFKSGGVVESLKITDTNRILNLLRKEKRTFLLFRTNYQKKTFIENILKPNGIPFVNMGFGWNIWTKKAVGINNALSKLFSGKKLNLDNISYLFLNIPSKPYLQRGLKTDLKKNRLKIKKDSYNKRDLYGIGVEKSFFDLSFNQVLDLLKINETSRDFLKERRLKDEINWINLYMGTIHSSKGKECDDVIVVKNISRRVLKDIETKKGRENEARVFYVGMSRCKERLVLVETGLGHNNPLFFPLQTVARDTQTKLSKGGVNVVTN